MFDMRFSPKELAESSERKRVYQSLLDGFQISKPSANVPKNTSRKRMATKVKKIIR